MASVTATLLSAAVRARRIRNLPELARFGRTLERMGAAAHYLFDPSWYQSRHPDVAASGIDLLVHYVLYGGAEGRDPSELFDGAWYVSQCPGGTGGLNPLVHYVVRGAALGLDPHPLFESSWYRAHYPDAESPELVDFVLRGQALRRRPNRVFDPLWYVDQEGGRAELDPHGGGVTSADALLHYFRSGGARGWEPAAWFSTRWWAHRAGVRPDEALAHFLRAPAARTAVESPWVLRASGAEDGYADARWDPSDHPPDRRPTVYYVEDLVPTTRLGAGYPRSVQVLRELARAGGQVVVLTTCQQAGSLEWDQVRAEIPDEVVVIPEFDRRQVAHLLRHAVGPGDLVWACRPENMAGLLEHWGDWRPSLAGATLLWDSEALASSREQWRSLPDDDRAGTAGLAASAGEISCAQAADTVAVVSAQDLGALRDAGLGNVVLIGHAVGGTPGAPTVEGRNRILFVGRLTEPESPNVDSLRWFVQEVGPRLGGRTLGRLDAVGLTGEPVTSDPLLADHLRGPQEQLEGWYRRARAFIAPTRFAAGVPIKVIDAAAAGVPVVATPILARQLGWTPGVELLVGETPEQFAACVQQLLDDEQLWDRLRRAALLRVASEYSPEVFSRQVGAALLRVHS